MTPENRAKMVAAVDGLREVRAAECAILRKREALEQAAREYCDATRGDLRALIDREQALITELVEVLDEETCAPGDRALWAAVLPMLRANGAVLSKRGGAIRSLARACARRLRAWVYVVAAFAGLMIGPRGERR